MLFLLLKKYPHYGVKHPTDQTGKAVTLEDYNDVECDNSASNKQETKREEKKGNFRDFYSNQLSLIKTFQ